MGNFYYSDPSTLRYRWIIETYCLICRHIFRSMRLTNDLFRFCFSLFNNRKAAPIFLRKGIQGLFSFVVSMIRGIINETAKMPIQILHPRMADVARAYRLRSWLYTTVLILISVNLLSQSTNDEPSVKSLRVGDLVPEAIWNTLFWRCEMPFFEDIRN